MTDKELFQQAKKLEVAWNSLKVSINALSVASVIVNYDDEWSSYFFQSQEASDLEDNLLNIANVMLKVSNVICPNDFDSSEV
ncbi:hypothetical protein [Lactiplantibacillus plantarum]|uniref:hypothetical protein n=1 Tax=Lactiplantibacillus plantarum TaxID=1590 RepID=UPI00097739D7|nr:hypothetical protein [Lactiplantibacillus plantarum]